MRQRKTNPAAGKQPANASVSGHTRNGRRVRAYSRNTGWARSKKVWADAAFTGVVSAGIVVEFGFTAISTAAVVLTAVLSTLAVFAGEYVEKNRPKLEAQRKARAKARQARRRKPTRRRTARPTQRRRR